MSIKKERRSRSRSVSPPRCYDRIRRRSPSQSRDRRSRQRDSGSRSLSRHKKSSSRSQSRSKESRSRNQSRSKESKSRSRPRTRRSRNRFQDRAPRSRKTSRSRSPLRRPEPECGGSICTLPGPEPCPKCPQTALHLQFPIEVGHTKLTFMEAKSHDSIAKGDFLRIISTGADNGIEVDTEYVVTAHADNVVNLVFKSLGRISESEPVAYFQKLDWAQARNFERATVLTAADTYTLDNVVPVQLYFNVTGPLVFPLANVITKPLRGFSIWNRSFLSNNRKMGRVMVYPQRDTVEVIKKGSVMAYLVVNHGSTPRRDEKKNLSVEEMETQEINAALQYNAFSGENKEKTPALETGTRHNGGHWSPVQVKQELSSPSLSPSPPPPVENKEKTPAMALKGWSKDQINQLPRKMVSALTRQKDWSTVHIKQELSPTFPPPPPKSITPKLMPLEYLDDLSSNEEGEVIG